MEQKIKLPEDTEINGKTIPAGTKIKVITEASYDKLDIESIIAAYKEAVMFTEEPMWEDENPDLDLGRLDFSRDAHNSIRKDIERFLVKAEKLGVDFNRMDSYQRGYEIEALIGHDIWLTRNGHGTGFWDRDSDQYGGQEGPLSRAAESLGESYSYISDDEEIEVD